MPVVLIVALAIAGTGSNGPSNAPSTPAVLPPVTVSAPPDTAAPVVSTCAQVISALPLTLDGLNLRRTQSTPPSSSIVAWGDPAIVLRCGVARPAQLRPGSADLTVAVNGVYFLPVKAADATTWTVIDRSVYLDVTVPTSYSQPPLGPIATAVAKVLPKPVCLVSPTAPVAKLCTRRT